MYIMKRILIIDDDPSTTESIASFLAESGYEVQTAANGVEGLEMVKKNAPDLIVSDIRMPKLTGLELLYVLNGMKFEKPVIFISSYDYLDASSTKLNIFAHIQKPINIFELYRCIKNALMQSEAAPVFSTN